MAQGRGYGAEDGRGGGAQEMTPIEPAATHLPCRCLVSLVAGKVEKWYCDRVVSFYFTWSWGIFRESRRYSHTPMIEAGAAKGKVT